MEESTPRPRHRNNRGLTFVLDDWSPIGPVLMIAPQVLGVWQLLTRGRGTTEMAGDLCISRSTINKYLQTLYAAVGARNRTEAAVLGCFMLSRYPALNRPIDELLARSA